ncbi:MAG: hypothetical protein RR085_06195, partial [Clostridia bacterium]
MKKAKRRHVHDLKRANEPRGYATEPPVSKEDEGVQADLMEEREAAADAQPVNAVSEHAQEDMPVEEER